jgi:hypothetical protein
MGEVRWENEAIHKNDGRDAMHRVHLGEWRMRDAMYSVHLEKQVCHRYFFRGLSPPQVPVDL